MSGLTSAKPKAEMGSATAAQRPTRRKQSDKLAANSDTNGHLSPNTADNKEYWRSLSRSPSPLGLIPIHQEWRTLIHKHEIPRKVLHVSIGFFSLWLYASGTQPSQLHPGILGALIPIATVDLIRHRVPSFNRFYISVLGALMRESEVDGYNGVISYLLGAWIVLRFFPKDVAVMGVLLLSWCDTAASTFGRMWGKYTPKIRKGKSLAGSLAALVTGIATALLFWGWFAPTFDHGQNEGENAFAFQGWLGLPESARKYLGWTTPQASLGGGLALAIMSLWAGFTASASEAVDIFGLDDNLTIPVLSAAGLWVFVKAFGQA